MKCASSGNTWNIHYNTVATYHKNLSKKHGWKQMKAISRLQEKNLSPNQLIPGYCLLCLLTSFQVSLYRYECHYRLCHVKHSVLIGRITLLACKCSEIKNQGTDNSCQNQHYHCHLCHWPKTSKESLFIHYTTQHEVEYDLIGHLVKKWRELMSRHYVTKRSYIIFWKSFFLITFIQDFTSKDIMSLMYMKYKPSLYADYFLCTV